jgi:hypothetical protein
VTKPLICYVDTEFIATPQWDNSPDSAQNKARRHAMPRRPWRAMGRSRRRGLAGAESQMRRNSRPLCPPAWGRDQQRHEIANVPVGCARWVGVCPPPPPGAAGGGGGPRRGGAGGGGPWRGRGGAGGGGGAPPPPRRSRGCARGRAECDGAVCEMEGEGSGMGMGGWADGRLGRERDGRASGFDRALAKSIFHFFSNLAPAPAPAWSLASSIPLRAPRPVSS